MGKSSEKREKFREETYSYYFGEIIRNRRKELKMSQEKLAEAVGKKRPYEPYPSTYILDLV